MAEFSDLLTAALAAPTPKLFIVFGLLFLAVAVVGSITGRIRPGPAGRVLGGLLGPLLIVGGLTMDIRPLPVPAVSAAVASVATSTPTLQRVVASSTASPPRPSSTPLTSFTPTPRSTLVATPAKGLPTLVTTHDPKAPNTVKKLGP